MPKLDIEAFAILLRSKQHNQHLVLQCVRPCGAVAHLESIVSEWSGPYPYEGRWHVIAECVKKLLPALPILRVAWDERVFKGRSAVLASNNGQEGQHGGTLDPATVTGALRSSTFVAQCHAVAALDLSMEQFAQWSAGCGCHGDHAVAFIEASKKEQEHGQQRRQRPFLQLLLAAHFGPEHRGCPMSGRRAPELACGQVQKVISGVFTQGLHHILAQMDCRKTEDLAALVDTFQMAKSEIIGVLALKLDFWQRWPWALAGLASTDPREAQAPVACLIISPS